MANGKEKDFITCCKKHLDKFSLPRLVSLWRTAQPHIRSLVMFLHKKGKFREFIRLASNSENDPYGLGALGKVYDKPVEEIEVEWKQWVRELPMDNDTFLVEESFVKTPQEWQKWWSENEHRLYFSAEEQIYRVKEAYREKRSYPVDEE